MIHWFRDFVLFGAFFENAANLYDENKYMNNEKRKILNT
jgi:hypothetical protein